MRANERLYCFQKTQNQSSKGTEQPAADSVAGLSGRELDAAVAERVMGWRVFDINDVKDDEWRDDLTNYPYLETYVGCALYTGRAEFRLWNPHLDLAAAMEVVEKMRERGWQIVIRSYEGAGPWDVTFANASESYGVPADNLPEAICRAALATKP